MHTAAPVFVAASQGMPTDSLALVAGEACITGSHEQVTVRETVLGRPLPKGSAQTVDGSITPVFL